MMTLGWFFPPPAETKDNIGKGYKYCQKRAGSGVPKSDQPRLKKQKVAPTESASPTQQPVSSVVEPVLSLAKSDSSLALSPAKSSSSVAEQHVPVPEPGSPVKSPPVAKRPPGRPRKINATFAREGPPKEQQAAATAEPPADNKSVLPEPAPTQPLCQAFCHVCGDKVRERFKCSLCVELVVCPPCVTSKRHRNVELFRTPVCDDHKFHSAAHTLMWLDCVEQLEVVKPSLPLYNHEQARDDPCLPLVLDWNVDGVFG